MVWWEAWGLTEQLVGSAVERLAGRVILVLLVVLDGSEVGQGPHEAPEVHLVLAETQPQNSSRLWATLKHSHKTADVSGPH